MTQKFASIELARLYEAQGYLEDALAMYQDLGKDFPEGGSEVRAAVKRLELALKERERQGGEPESAGEGGTQAADDPAAFLLATLDEINGEAEAVFPAPPRSDGEERIAGLMENWLALMVVRKRLQLFKTILARV